MRSHMSTSSEGRSIIVLFDENGDVATINESHPNFVRIAQAVGFGEDPSQWLNSSTDWFEAEYLNDADTDLCIDCGEYADDCDCDYADRDEFNPTTVIESLSETIERYRREGRDPSNLVRFMHRLARNPSRRSREQLFNWTRARDMTVDLEGFIVGFKGVRERTEGTDLLPLDRYPYQSSSPGHGIVDGIEIVNGHLPMGVGAVISIPRDEVQDDPTIGCHVGLHVGTHAYATGFAPVLVEVRFDPADVVSVPTDSEFAKLRCCRYEVVAVHVLDDDDLSAHEPDATWSQDEAMDSFMDFVPQTFLDRLRDRILNRGKR